MAPAAPEAGGRDQTTEKGGLSVYRLQGDSCQMDEVRFLRIGEVAELLRISRTKVYELMASGQIPTLHLGRSCRVPLAALRDWIDEQTEQAAPVL